MMRNIVRVFIWVFVMLMPCAASARTYLVSVGIADYSAFPIRINSLRLPPKDAETMAGLFAKNTSVDYALLLNEKATKARILKAIRKVFAKASEDDVVIFFFSGHGYAGGLCAYDGNIKYGDIRNVMSQSKCKNKMMFVDACRSGGMRVGNADTNGYMSAAKKANIMLFLSSRNNENSIERKDMRNGFFTTYLYMGLKGNADADKDRTITAKELFEFVYGGVVQLSGGRQHPVMWGSFSDNMVVMKW